MRAGDPNYDVKRLPCIARPSASTLISSRLITRCATWVSTPPVWGVSLATTPCARVCKGDGGYETLTGEKLWEWAASQYGARKQPNGVDEYVDVPLVTSM